MQDTLDTIGTVNATPVIIVRVAAEVWATRQALKSEIAAREKAVKAIEERIGFPDAKEVGKAASIVIVDGNGQEIGKGCVFHFPGSVTPEGWRRRIS
jgi:hypothetical protein